MLNRSTGHIRPTRSAGAAARGVPLLFVLLSLLAASGGCDSPLDDLNMRNTPRYEPGEPSEFFADGKADRAQPAGTIAQGQLITDENRLLHTGKQNGKHATAYPFEITRADLERGRRQYEIFCAVCHNSTGTGDGMIVQRGFVRPPSLLEQRLIEAPPGHYFDVITNGWGAMYSYNDRINVEDRWRIAAYIRVLQLSQRAPVESLPQPDQERVRNAPAAQPPILTPPLPQSATPGAVERGDQ